MDQHKVRVVVGQGDPGRGPLRDVLTDDGFDVVGVAADAAALAVLLRADQPDVVVLDDAIGVAAAQLVAELAPRSKLIVIWPAGVIPIGGAARVEPREIALALSATVGLVAGAEMPSLETIERPDWIDKVRKDPSTLREKLAAGAAAPARPSVTELQRRGRRLHPGTGTGRRRRARSATAAAVGAATVLPFVGDGETAGDAAGAGDAASAGAAAAAGTTDATHDRRIGMIALGGAAAAGALMIALSFGARGPVVITGERFIPPITSLAPLGDGSAPTTPVTQPNDPGSSGPTTTTTGGSVPTGPGTTVTGPVLGGPSGGGGPTGGTGGPGGGTGGPGGGGSGGSGGGGTTRNVLAAVAGASVSQNPHNGPPGIMDSGSAANNPHGGPPGLVRKAEAGPAGSHAGGHTPHGAHPAHPDHPAHTHKR